MDPASRNAHNEVMIIGNWARGSGSTGLVACIVSQAYANCTSHNECHNNAHTLGHASVPSLAWSRCQGNVWRQRNERAIAASQGGLTMSSELWWLVLGLLLGWLIEWVIDWVYWRRRRQAIVEDAQL